MATDFDYCTNRNVFSFQTLFTTTENEESNCLIWEKQVCLKVFLNCSLQWLSYKHERFGRSNNCFKTFLVSYISTFTDFCFPLDSKRPYLFLFQNMFTTFQLKSLLLVFALVSSWPCGTSVSYLKHTRHFILEIVLSWSGTNFNLYIWNFPYRFQTFWQFYLYNFS